MEKRLIILKSKAIEIQKNFSIENQDLIYFQSILNFLLHFHSLENQLEKRSVIEKLEFYFTQIEEKTFNFCKSERKEILDNFINPISVYYKRKVGFKLHINLKGILFLGFNLDLILLLFGILRKFHFVPICTFCLFLYWLYIEIFFARKNKVF